MPRERQNMKVTTVQEGCWDSITCLCKLIKSRDSAWQRSPLMSIFFSTCSSKPIKHRGLTLYLPYTYTHTVWDTDFSLEDFSDHSVACGRCWPPLQLLYILHLQTYMALKARDRSVLKPLCEHSCFNATGSWCPACPHSCSQPEGMAGRRGRMLVWLF